MPLGISKSTYVSQEIHEFLCLAVTSEITQWTRLDATKWLGLQVTCMICVCVRACVHACVCVVCVCACLPVCICAYVTAYVHACV